jgi:hypothetical protein
MTFVALAALALALPSSAQTVSQKCVESVRETFPDEVTVWVVAAHARDDHTELRWRSASGRLGVCRLEPGGTISDVAVTGFREPGAAQLMPSEPEPRTFEPYRLTCESEHGGRQRCDIEPAAIVVLVEQLGEESCIAGLTWGHEGDEIWVDSGCRGEFEVSPAPPRLEPSSLGQAAGEQRESGEGMNHPRFQETRAQQQCRNLAAGRGVLVRRILGSRIEGESVVVLMEAETWSQRQEVTCRYDPATDQAVIAR